MYHDLAPRLAELLTSYNIPIREGEFVVIQGSIEAIPVISELARRVLDKGGIPFTQIALPDYQEYFMKNATQEQFDFISPVSEAVMEKADVMFSIEAPLHTRALASVDPARLKMASQGAQRKLFGRFMQRDAEGSVRWNGSAYPTHAGAQEAGMGFLDYQKLVYEAYGLHLDDPVAYWLDMKDRQLQLVNWMKGKHRVEIKGPGIDMSFDMHERPWVSCHGDKNFPDGEIFTSPIENSVNGRVEFSYPGYYLGNQVEGVKFTFKDGKVIEASADKGEAFLLSQLNTDEGARYLGEFAIGTNTYIQNITGSVLFDEKIGGTIHMAVGHSIGESGGVNESSIHWDMVHNMREGGEIWVDGEKFYESGKFLLA